MFVSVIIPVFNDVERLKLCLDALEQQGYPKDLYEVIIIDNGSTIDHQAVIQAFQQCKLDYESTPGSYAARNKGLALARGNIVAFTDSDCIPALDWLEQGVKSLLAVPNCGVLAGKIEMFFQDHSNPTAVELYDSVTFLQQEEYVKSHQSAATANLFTFRSVFGEVGLFNATLKSGGDGEWSKRVAASGYKVAYSESARVRHPARYSLSEIQQKMLRILQGIHEIDLKRGDLGRAELKRRLIQCLTALRPPVRSAIQKVSTEHRLENNYQKLQVLTIFVYMHYIKTFKRIHLYSKSLASS